MKHASCQPPMRLALLFIVVLWSYTTLYTVYSYRSPTISLNDTSDSREVFVADIEWIPSTVQRYASYACMSCNVVVFSFGYLVCFWTPPMTCSVTRLITLCKLCGTKSRQEVPCASFGRRTPLFLGHVDGHGHGVQCRLLLNQKPLANG